MYHGSNVEVKEPKIIQSDRRLDFGTGFYLTTSYVQAERWAELTTARRGVGRETIKRLLPQKLRDQYAFKTSAALDCLKLCEVIINE